MEDLNKNYVQISRRHLLYFLRNKPSKCVTVGPGLAGQVHRFWQIQSKNGHETLFQNFPIIFEGFRAV